MSSRGRGRWWLAPLALAILAAGCVTQPELKIRRDARPAETGDGWEVSNPAAEGLDPAALDQVLDLFYSEDEYRNAISLLVVRHGNLVLEAFARDPREREVKRNIQSVTKSVTSLVFGIARDQGYFPDLDQTLYSILPEKFGDNPAKRAITLRHLLTMRSGLAFDNDDFSIEMLVNRPHDQARYILKKPLYATPGDSFYYRDADPQLLSSAIERVTGQTVEALAREHLFGPMGITDYFWEANVDGTSLGAHALYLRGRDLAKLGELALRHGRMGRCEGTRCQLVSEEWMDLSTARQTDSDRPAFPYGFYWWTVPELTAFTAWGHGGNYVLVVPEEEMVIVLTSLPDAGDEVGTELDEFLPLVRRVIAAAG